MGWYLLIIGLILIVYGVTYGSFKWFFDILTGKKGHPDDIIVNLMGPILTIIICVILSYKMTVSTVDHAMSGTLKTWVKQPFTESESKPPDYGIRETLKNSNLRSGPSLNHKIICVVKKGNLLARPMSLTHKEKLYNGFCPVYVMSGECKRQKGYISNELLTSDYKTGFGTILKAMSAISSIGLIVCVVIATIVSEITERIILFLIRSPRNPHIESIIIIISSCVSVSFYVFLGIGAPVLAVIFPELILILISTWLFKKFLGIVLKRETV